MIENSKIACVVPCFRETKHVLGVLEKIPTQVDQVFVIDDCCPDRTGDLVNKKKKDPRVKVIFLEKNLGVGGATVAGYKEALNFNNDIVVKIDGDGQMDPQDLMKLVKPILEKKSDYSKGNRFLLLKNIRSMPIGRIFGNICLNFFSKFSSGFWEISDPTNGYTAIHKTALLSINLDELQEGYFFESDMLSKLYLANATVKDVSIPAYYGSEESGINIFKIIPLFLYLHSRNFFVRIFLVYFIRDFSFYSLNLLFGSLLMAFGIIFGCINFVISIFYGVPATAGTVMISALPILIGFVSLMQFMINDIKNFPKVPLQNFNPNKENALKF